MKLKQYLEDFKEFYEDEEYEEDDEEEYISSSESKFLREWQAIVKAAEHNPALQNALERVKLVYHLSKE
jgi:hypothetical protein